MTLLFHSYRLCEEIVSALLRVQAGGKANPELQIPDFLCSGFERPNKKIAIKEKQTRFDQ